MNNSAHFQLDTAATNRMLADDVVAVTGEVDAGNVAEFAQAVSDLPGPRPLIVDLSPVRYFDSAGFAALDRMLAERTIVLVIAPHGVLSKAAKLICMPAYGNADAARAALNPQND
jgi:anti-sigma B factor antagonist